MSRHRIVRAMDYSEEYDGFDDVYGHSVEDDYCISPSDAAQFMFDRTRQPQMSAFFNEENDIAEEDESNIEICKQNHSGKYQRPDLSKVDEVRLHSCLEEIRNVIGDSIPEHVLINTVLKNEFNFNKALDAVLTSVTSAAEKPEADAPKPQRERRTRDRGAKRSTGIPDEPRIDDSSTSSRQSGTVLQEEKLATAPTVKVVPPGTKTVNITKGFDVPTEKPERDGSDSLKPESNTASPRSQSPSSGRMSPSSMGANITDSLSDYKTLVVKEMKMSARSHDNKVDILAHYQQERGQSKEQLHMVVIGHVDAGKSTLMGHLLYSLGQVNKKIMHKYEQESKKLGKQSFVYAWILDETGEERSRGITMDIGQSKFETKTKVVTLLDAPGHKDFIPNMITGATQADVALLVVDATRGEFETGFESGGQTREHALLVRSLGVCQLGVVVNKLDTVSWSQERFEEVVGKLGAFLRQAGFRESDVTFVPCSGLTGENLISPPSECMLLQWYKGPCLLDVIDKFKSPERPITKPFRLSVNDIFKGTGSGFCVSGRVETGMVQVGDKVLVQPQNEGAVIKALNIDDVAVQVAFAGDHVSATLSGIDMQNVSVGYILCDPMQPIPVTSHFEARIVVFNVKLPITKGYSVILHHQSLLEQAVVTKLVAQLHKSSGEVIKRRPRCLVRNSNAVVELETSHPICLELYKNIKELGRFMLRVGGITVAAGLVTQIF
ncbi:HBS1-like protein isoform X2 [Zootermopsis nevadensis]|uniref:HBS1-like protein n=1 Tax=Zootermopsis nevadensis TaxID=136037 RepID=A0A067R832_ZOONE|nr:HBS1-like protein isoform X2 [Zootermopsis nevadensis]KDR18612.1 HBS1-like protein [Zootermopsis nevadensis]